MAYASYDYYRTVYHGTAIAAPDASRLLQRASSFLDYYTQGRAAKSAELHALKMACCAIAEQYQYIDMAQALAKKSISSAVDGNGELQSQTVGSWSKTYRSGGDSAKQALESAQAAKASLVTIAQQYLSGTGLLFRGRGCRDVPTCCDAI